MYLERLVKGYVNKLPTNKNVNPLIFGTNSKSNSKKSLKCLKYGNSIGYLKTTIKKANEL